jgi:hypothetical protein
MILLQNYLGLGTKKRDNRAKGFHKFSKTEGRQLWTTFHVILWGLTVVNIAYNVNSDW